MEIHQKQAASLNDSLSRPLSAAVKLKSKQVNWKHLVWLALILIVVSAAFLFIVRRRSEVAAPVVNRSGPEIKAGLPKDYKFAAVSGSNLPAQFPKELILSVGEYHLVRGETTTVTTGKIYRVVEFQTADQPDSAAGLYRNTLTNNKFAWQLKTSNVKNKIISLEFYKTPNRLLVTITPQNNGSGSQINLAYFNQ